MLTMTEMKELKRQLGLTNEDVAEITGVSLSTIQKVFGGTVKAPRRGTLEKLSEGFERYEAQRRRETGTGSAGRAGSAGNSSSQHGGSFEEEIKRGKSADHGMLRETAFQYSVGEELWNQGADAANPDRYGGRRKGQGEYTLEDYYAWPEEERVELIDGRIYSMTAPYVKHQLIIVDIMEQFLVCRRKHGMTCLLLVSPVDVQLDMDDRTMVQPDIVILCDLAKNINRCIYGAPDFVLEVLSPSTRSKDKLLKLHKYYAAGCREYWIVDPETMTVDVHDFEHEELNMHYTFDDQVPVRISEGKCTIDFSRIRDSLQKFMR